MKFKFITAGQNPIDAGVITQVIRGESLKPLAPVNLQMYRGLGMPSGNTNNAGSIGLQWTRRSRISPGFRPSSDLPFGEEIIRYEVEIMDGSDGVLRTIYVDEDDFTPFLWHLQAYNFAGLVIDYDGSGTVFDGTLVAAGIVTFGIVVSKYLFDVGSDDIVMGFTVDTTTSVSYAAPSHFGLIPASLITSNISKVTPVIGFERNTGSATTTTKGLATNVNLVGNTNARLMIKVNRSGQASLHQDSGGHLTAPLGGQTVTLAPGLYVLMVKNGVNQSDEESCRVIGANLRRRDHPCAFYSVNDAKADFGGTLPVTLTVRVYQVSPIVGRGPYTEATFTL